MGARLWPQRRSSRAARPPPSPQQHSQTILPPNAFTHSVLYVYNKGMTESVPEAMAAARDRATRVQSIQQDTTLGYPIQVPMRDGEEGHCSLPNMKQLAATTDFPEAEITREFIRPPPNISPFDVVKGEGPHSHRTSFSAGYFSPPGDWRVVHDGTPHHHHHHHHQQQQQQHHHHYHHHHHHHHHQTLHNHRHSTSMDVRSTTHPVASSGSSSSSSSYGLGWGSGDDLNRGSPKRGRKTTGIGSQLIAKCKDQFTSPKNERPPQSSLEGARRGSHHQGGLGAATLTSPSEPYYPTATTLADIRTVSVPCGSSHSPTYPSGSGASPGTLIGSNLGVQHGDLSLSPYEHSCHSDCSVAPPDQDPPPLYSEVRENPTLFESVSRPSEQRTNSGKI